MIFLYRIDVAAKDPLDKLLAAETQTLQKAKTELEDKMIEFANARLKKFGKQVLKLKEDFADGLRLILLVGDLFGYFVPLYEYQTNPQTREEKLQNVRLVIDLMNNENCPENLAHGVVDMELNAILRIMYHLFKASKSK